jgi:hypothetical protein
MATEEKKSLENNYDYDKIVAQGLKEITESRDYVREKRIAFRDRLKLYNNQRKQKDKIGDNSIYTIMTTMLAVYYSDELEVGFTGRDISDIEAADNAEKLAKFDYDEMEMEVINYKTQWDRFFFGVGIRQISDWDKKRKTPMPKSLNPLCWLPDPNGSLVMKNFRYSGFEVSYSRGEMTEECGFFNLNLLDKKRAKTGTEQELNEAAYTEAQNLGETEYQDNPNKDNEVYDMVDHFMMIKGADGISRKFLVTFDDAVKDIFRFEEIEAITTEEKSNPALVPFPLTLNYYSPNRTDPFGTSVPDLVEDKQRAKSIFKNLQLAAVKADLYPMYLYNRDKILNRRDLDFAFNKFIPVRGDVDAGTIQPFNKSTGRMGESLNIIQALDNDANLAVGADKNAQGVLSEQDRTATEVQQTTANANLRFMLGSKVNAWGEKKFWKLWYRLYRQNMQAAEKKNIRLSSALGSNYLTLTRKDFITKEDPDISIKSKLEVEQKRSRDRVAWAAILPMIIQDPTKPLAAKRFAERHLLRLHNLPSEEIAMISPKTPDEMRAGMENELLNKNNFRDVKVEANEDHLSHMLIHSQAEQTDAALAHINAHKMAYFETGQYERDMQARQQMGSNQQVNTAQNQIANQNANLNNTKGQPTSLEQGNSGQ